MRTFITLVPAALLLSLGASSLAHAQTLEETIAYLMAGREPGTLTESEGSLVGPGKADDLDRFAVTVKDRDQCIVEVRTPGPAYQSTSSQRIVTVHWNNAVRESYDASVSDGAFAISLRSNAPAPLMCVRYIEQNSERHTRIEGGDDCSSGLELRAPLSDGPMLERKAKALAHLFGEFCSFAGNKSAF